MPVGDIGALGEGGDRMLSESRADGILWFLFLGSGLEGLKPGVLISHLFFRGWMKHNKIQEMNTPQLWQYKSLAIYEHH
jgi:hypothetical protein